MRRAKVRYRGRDIDITVADDGAGGSKLDAGGQALDPADVTWLAPQPSHGSPIVIGLALNYADHAKELDFKKLPDHPILFVKNPSSITGHLQPVFRPDGVDYMHYETELGVVIGKRARKVSRANAMRHVAGYTVCNDFTVRDFVENFYRPPVKAKGFDSFGPIGPWIVDAGDVADPQALNLRTFVNGELRQQGSTRDMIFDIPAIIEYVTAFMTLRPGDIISTGTPKGCPTWSRAIPSSPRSRVWGGWKIPSSARPSTRPTGLATSARLERPATLATAKERKSLDRTPDRQRLRRQRAALRNDQSGHRRSHRPGVRGVGRASRSGGARGAPGFSGLGRHAGQETGRPDPQVRRRHRPTRGRDRRAGDPRYRPGHRADPGQDDSPRLGQFLFLCRDVYSSRRPHLSGRRSDPSLHITPAGRRGRFDHAVERTLHAGDLESGSGHRPGQYRGSQAGRTGSHDGRFAGKAGSRGRIAARRRQCRARPRRGYR